jgi:hypothetical protein
VLPILQYTHAQQRHGDAFAPGMQCDQLIPHNYLQQGNVPTSRDAGAGCATPLLVGVCPRVTSLPAGKVHSLLHAGAASMLFFLHAPRTAGTTYHNCFLKLGTPPSARCLRSYDVLRLDSSITGCALLASHDDFSIRRRLPADTAVVTLLRWGACAPCLVVRCGTHKCSMR